MTKQEAVTMKRFLEAYAWPEGCICSASVRRCPVFDYAVEFILGPTEEIAYRASVVIPRLPEATMNDLFAEAVAMVERAWDQPACSNKLPEFLRDPDHIEPRPAWQARAMTRLWDLVPVSFAARQLAIELVKGSELEHCPDPHVWRTEKKSVVMTWGNPETQRVVTVECRGDGSYEIFVMAPDVAGRSITVRNGQAGGMHRIKLDVLRTDLAWCFAGRASAGRNAA